MGKELSNVTHKKNARFIGHFRPSVEVSWEENLLTESTQ